MDLLLFTDLHLHKYSYANILASGENELLMAGLDIIQQIYSYAKTHGIKRIYFLGDMFHHRQRLDTELYFKYVYTLFKKLFVENDDGIQLIMIPGNHDQINKQGDNTLVALEDINKDRIVVYSENKIEQHEDMKIFLCPHTYDTPSLYDFLSTSTEKDLILMHQLIYDSPALSNSTFFGNETVRTNELKYHMLFSGHNHRPFQSRNSPVFNIGAPMHHNFGDAEAQDRFFIHYKSSELLWIKTDFPKFSRAAGEGSYSKKRKKTKKNYNVRLQITDQDTDPTICKKYLISKQVLETDRYLQVGLELIDPEST